MYTISILSKIHLAEDTFLHNEMYIGSMYVCAWACVCSCEHTVCLCTMLSRDNQSWDSNPLYFWAKSWYSKIGGFLWQLLWGKDGDSWLVKWSRFKMYLEVVPSWRTGASKAWACKMAIWIVRQDLMKVATLLSGQEAPRLCPPSCPEFSGGHAEGCSCAGQLGLCMAAHGCGCLAMEDKNNNKKDILQRLNNRSANSLQISVYLTVVNVVYSLLYSKIYSTVCFCMFACVCVCVLGETYCTCWYCAPGEWGYSAVSSGGEDSWSSGASWSSGSCQSHKSLGS